MYHLILRLRAEFSLVTARLEEEGRAAVLCAVEEVKTLDQRELRLLEQEIQSLQSALDLETTKTRGQIRFHDI